MSIPIPMFWNESLEPDIARYLIYFGTASGLYNAVGSPQDMGNAVAGTVNLPGGGRWFLAFTVINTSGQQSQSSSEIVADFLITRSTVRGT